MAVQRLDQLVAMHDPLVHKLKGRVVRDQRGVTIGKVTIPHHLQGKFERRCQGYESIQKAVWEKDIRLHGKPTERGPYWFAVVSGEFRPIAVREVSDALGKVSSGVEVRFGVDDDFQLHYQPSGGPNGINLFLYSGGFGMYGGNGESAVRCGVSIYNGASNPAVLFQRQEFNARVIHKKSHESLDAVIARLKEFAEGVPALREASRVIMLPREAVERYVQEHLRRIGGAQFQRSVMAGLPRTGEISAYALAEQISYYAGRLKSARMRAEDEAGRLMMDSGQVLAPYVEAPSPR